MDAVALIEDGLTALKFQGKREAKVRILPGRHLT